MLFDLAGGLIALGASALVVGLLYLLRERFKKAVVSYLPLWEHVIKKTPAAALMKNFRRIFSYLLQLLIIVLLILSITDTGLGGENESRAVAVLIDTTTSMTSTDEEPSRLDEAKDFAVSLARSMKKNDKALLLEMNDSPRVVHSWTEKPEEIIRSIRTLEPSMRENGFIASLKLSAAALEGMDADERQIWVLSDGAYEPSKDNLSLLRSAVKEIRSKGIIVHHVKTGRESSNRAITRFAARQNLREKLKLSANVVIDTFEKQGDARENPCEKINLEILSGDDPVFKKSVGKQRFGETLSLDIPVPAGRILSAKISSEGEACGRDFLGFDDTARIELPEQMQLKILAVTEGNTYLMAALILSPLWNVEIITPGEKPSSSRYDVVVADAAPVPGGVKRKGTLFIDPQEGDVPLERKGIMEGPAFREYDYDHPALRWTNLYNVNVAGAVRFVPRADDEVLAAGGEGPLIIELKPGEGRRDMVLAFALQDTDMPMRTTWPLLFINILYYLSGTAMQVSSASNSPRESDITPRWLPAAARTRNEPASRHDFPLWIVLLLAALCLSGLEWFSFHRRWTV